MATAATTERRRKKLRRSTESGAEEKGNAHSVPASMRTEKKRVGEYRFDGQEPGKRTRHKNQRYTGKT